MADGIGRAADTHGATGDAVSPASAGTRPNNGSHQFGPAGAHQARDAQDFALPHVEADVVERAGAAESADRQSDFAT